MPDGARRRMALRPLRRASMPRRRRERFAGRFPVVSEKCGAFFFAALRLLEDAGDRRVRHAAALRELRAVRDFLRERMLERVLGLREQHLLEDEIAAA